MMAEKGHLLGGLGSFIGGVKQQKADPPETPTNQQTEGSNMAEHDYDERKHGGHDDCDDYDKRCKIHLHGHSHLEGYIKCYEADFKIAAKKVPCTTAPDDLIAVVNGLPPFSEIMTVTNFGPLGWVITYKYRV